MYVQFGCINGSKVEDVDDIHEEDFIPDEHSESSSSENDVDSESTSENEVNRTTTPHNSEVSMIIVVATVGCDNSDDESIDSMSD